jgi:L-lactate dehydrogenase complex protein LldF
MSENQKFIKQGASKARDEIHRRKILKAVSTYEVQVDIMKNGQFKDWEQARQIAGQIKDEVLENWPGLLEEFEEKITTRGVKVHWAKDKKEALNCFFAITKKHQAKSVVKSKSMTTEEIGFNEFCEENNIDVLESDLGELIVQLGDEKPYHIVTPAMHKTRAEVGQLFQEKLGAPETNDAQELTMIAREHLRNAYIIRDIGVTGANFIIADEGAIQMTENEGNGRLTMSCPPVHVIFVGIEKILPRLTDLSLFSPLLATSGTGQQMTGYNSVIRGPRFKGENDGPDEMHVILLDNGRTELFGKKQYQTILKCIRCGACLNACPVYRTIGGHSYLTTYQGPIGSVISPQFRGLKDFGHLAFASSLCGACTNVCPVNIDIHNLLLETRWEMYQKNYTGIFWNVSLKVWSWIMTNRSRLNLASRVLNLSYKLFLPFLPAGKRKRIPMLPKKSFEVLWEQYEQQR